MVEAGSANVDPRVFTNPLEFDPNRADMGEMLGWNARLEDVISKEAVRPCPGTKSRLTFLNAEMFVLRIRIVYAASGRNCTYISRNRNGFVIADYFSFRKIKNDGEIKALLHIIRGITANFPPIFRDFEKMDLTSPTPSNRERDL